MVFKGRFFSSKKSSSDSSPDANSPRLKKKSSSSSPSPSSPADVTKSSSSSPSKSLKHNSKTSTPPPPAAASAAASVSPILASSLGLNKIKTRSGPLPQESFYGFRSDKGIGVGSSNLSRNSAKKDAAAGSSWLDNVAESGSGSDTLSTGSGPGSATTPNVAAAGQPPRSRLSSSGGNLNASWEHSGGIRSPAVIPEGQTTDDCETPKESESPRFQAILRATSGPRKRNPADMKSFSHELNSKGVRPYPFWKPRGLNNLEEVLGMIRGRFEKAKEEVDSDLAVFAADLVGVLEKNAESHPDWQETIEDLLILARKCAMTSPNEFWLQCEGIVQELDDRRQELPPGTLKQLHTRMLFMLTRCTRLLQFHKETGYADEGHVLNLRKSTVLQPAEKRVPHNDRTSSGTEKNMKGASAHKFYSQEQHGLSMHSANIFSTTNKLTNSAELVAGRERIASWKKLPSPIIKSKPDPSLEREQSEKKLENLKIAEKTINVDFDPVSIRGSEVPSAKVTVAHSPSSEHHRKPSLGRGDPLIVPEESSIICRICEEEVPTLYVEDHSRICAIADSCDQKGLSVNERLLRVAETLEKMMEAPTLKDYQAAVGSPDAGKVSNSSVTEETDVFSPKLSDWSRRGSEDMLDCFPEADNSTFMDDLKGLTSISCKTRFGPKSDQGMTTSSAGSMTPRSPFTPRTNRIDLLLSGKCGFPEHEDHAQMVELSDIARCSASALSEDDRSINYLLTCLEDLGVVVGRRKFDALTVETFGARIEKLIREKYLQLLELVDNEKIDLATTVIDEDTPMDDDVVRSLRTSPIHSAKDRTSIDDFEIIKPISRGAFGRVFLAKKRTTGDLFAIKVLKKADMIRKNAVESILAERDILISVRNPFVVRFFYSFTCRENLYLVMEYLNGGDLYSLLRNLGCLDEEVARVYIAEVVLALEYLHSLHVVHRDLKPDNLLIAHDGHIKLTDFGLSKVGLINSTDDLSGPAVSGTSLFEEEDQPQLSASEKQQERRKKRSAVGTPDYLAPEILLGTGHGTTADWWSVGVILFELIVGIPPFNAEHPQIIFDNILNRNIPWPRVPEEMSYDAADLIDKLLIEDPNQRLGAGGAAEVKAHPYFRDINWDTLARQKAAFVPAFESAHDTSYFTSRYSWNHSEDQVNAASEFDDTSDDGMASGSSGSMSDKPDELGDDECVRLTGFENSSAVNYSFSNFSFKNLSQLASINYDLLTKGWKDDPPQNSNV